ncbi:MAG: hypothetical protein ACLUEQ_03260 [Cloacibacillus evryensis]
MANGTLCADMALAGIESVIRLTSYRLDGTDRPDDGARSAETSQEGLR